MAGEPSSEPSAEPPEKPQAWRKSCAVILSQRVTILFVLVHVLRLVSFGSKQNLQITEDSLENIKFFHPPTQF